MVDALLATVIGMEEISRWPSELSEWLISALRQRPLSIGPAPIALTVSRLPMVSTSTDCLSRPSPRLRDDMRSSAGVVTMPDRMTSGIIASGRTTSTPPSMAITAKVTKMKGTSISAVSVTEAKKSRNVSSSRISPVSAPVDPRR